MCSDKLKMSVTKCCLCNDKKELEVRGRARREAARRRKSEWKVNLGIEIPLAAMAGRMKRFSENTSTIPEVMDSLNFSQILSFHD